MDSENLNEYEENQEKDFDLNLFNHFQPQNLPTSNISSSLNTNVFKLCSDGDLTNLKRIIQENNFSVNSLDESGNSLLNIACSKGHFNTIRYLIEDKSCDINHQGQFGYTPLHNACVNYQNPKEFEITSQNQIHIIEREEKNSLLIIEYLVNKGCYINSQDSNQRTPLHLASLLGKFEIIKFLVLHSADKQIKDKNGFTACDLFCKDLFSIHSKVQDENNAILNILQPQFQMIVCQLNIL